MSRVCHRPGRRSTSRKFKLRHYQRLRKIDGRQDVPVVAITGFGRSDDIARARAAGFHSHLTKPLNLKVLADVLQQLANEKTAAETNVDYDISAGPVF